MENERSDEFAVPRMPLPQTLQVLVRLRKDDQIVVTSMGTAREWPRQSDHALDFHYVPSTMSGAVPLALGLALAQPQREVLVCSGDGSLLMSLGCLVTAVDSGVRNLTVALFDNGVYEITGGQRTAAAQAEVNFSGLAQAAGFPNVAQFWDLADWRSRAAQVLALPGPRFLWLQVEPEHDDYLLDPPCPMQEQLERLRTSLQRKS
ncbi:MAG: thiamine pyrophosphate-dependent enzyme [Planctomycetes bacterium]|nr:thiamine pyrophosphate-dependent enzyme [Planctomycetota bacterium]